MVQPPLAEPGELGSALGAEQRPEQAEGLAAGDAAEHVEPSPSDRRFVVILQAQAGPGVLHELHDLFHLVQLGPSRRAFPRVVEDGQLGVEVVGEAGQGRLATEVALEVAQALVDSR